MKKAVVYARYSCDSQTEQSIEGQLRVCQQYASNNDFVIFLISTTENIPDTPEGIILETLLEGIAEYYSAELSQKIKRGMNETRLKRNFTGGYVLYGYKMVDHKIVIDEDQAEIVHYIFNQYAIGAYINEIYDYLIAFLIVVAYFDEVLFITL